MARFTAELHELLKDNEFKTDLQKVMNSYPLYKAKNPDVYGHIPSREELNKKIIDHYRFWEIGSETPKRFLYNLETTLNEIMPYYNQMFKSVDIMNGIDDIFANVDITEVFDENKTGKMINDIIANMTGTAKGKSNNEVISANSTDTDMNTNGRNVKSTTPQSQLSVKTIDNITAASEINWNEDGSKSTSKSNDKSTTASASESENNQENKSNATQVTEDKTGHTFTKRGNQGVNTYAHDMLEFRRLITNIELDIINDPELVKCFNLVW